MSSSRRSNAPHSGLVSYLSDRTAGLSFPPLVASAVLVTVIVLTLSAVRVLHVSVSIVRSAPKILNNDDLFRSPTMLGPEFEIFEWIRTNLPTGTEISVYFEDTYHIETLRRITRLWLSLLPEYPISGSSPYVVCPEPMCRMQEGDALIVRGERLVLIERREE